MPAAGSANVRAVLHSWCCTNPRSACAAITVRWNCAYRVPARPAAMLISNRWGAARNASKKACNCSFPDARLLRIDADSTRRKGSAQAAFESVHRGEVDILIGTQMVGKGHDFQNLTLPGRRALNRTLRCFPTITAPASGYLRN